MRLFWPYVLHKPMQNCEFLTADALSADEESQASISMTLQLIHSIIHQIDEVQSINEVAVEVPKQNFKKSKEANLKRSFDNICKLIPEEQRRYLHSANEKGASPWLASGPKKPWLFIKQKRVS